MDEKLMIVATVSFDVVKQEDLDGERRAETGGDQR